MTEQNSQHEPRLESPPHLNNPEGVYNSQGNFSGYSQASPAQQAGHPFYAPHAPETEKKELAYHRLAFADMKSRWWKPLVEAIIGGAIFMALSFAVMFAYLGYLMVGAGGDFGVLQAGLDLSVLQNNSLRDPATFLMMFISVVIMWPSLWLARLCMGPKPWGLIHSVAGRMRWSWLFLCTAISIMIFVIVPVLVELVVGGLTEGLAVPEVELPVGRLVFMLCLVFLVVPFQCYAEELVFRGFLMQTIGRWLKAPVWAVVLPAPLFMFGHAYDFWGQASILVMGIAAGFMAWYTGGLEAGIAMHVVNNLYLMTLGVLGMVDPFAQGGSTWADFLMATGMEVILVLIVMYAAKRVGVARTSHREVLVRSR